MSDIDKAISEAVIEMRLGAGSLLAAKIPERAGPLLSYADVLDTAHREDTTIADVLNYLNAAGLDAHDDGDEKAEEVIQSIQIGLKAVLGVKD